MLTCIASGAGPSVGSGVILTWSAGGWFPVGPGGAGGGAGGRGTSWPVGLADDVGVCLPQDGRARIEPMTTNWMKTTVRFMGLLVQTARRLSRGSSGSPPRVVVRPAGLAGILPPRRPSSWNRKKHEAAADRRQPPRWKMRTLGTSEPAIHLTS